MSQLNIYVPDEVEKQIRTAAKKEGKTISSFLAELIRSHFLAKKQKDYFSQFFGEAGSKIPEVKRPLPKKRDEL